MNHIETAISQVIEENYLPYEWSEQIEKELDKVSLDENLPRKDLTNMPFITIDGADAKDFDDAIFCEQKKSSIELHVAIADVAEIVRPGTAINKEAIERGTSIYFPSKVIPMLPEKISNGLCSLVPNEIRNVLVCKIAFAADGEKESYEFFEARIKSHRRMTYIEVENHLKNSNNELPDAVKASIQCLHTLTKKLLVKRSHRSALEIEGQEPLLKINRDGAVEEITLPSRLYAHQMIEEAMLAANVSAASFMKKHYKFGVYRNHEEPDNVKLESLKTFFLLKGFSKSFKKSPLELVNQCLGHAKEHKLDKVLQTVVLQSLKVGQDNFNKDIDTLELKLAEAIMAERPAIDQGIGFIKIISVIAPLAGLLGTVTGMIVTFQMITLYGTGDPKLMAGGISQALVTTVLGLLVAIPTSLLHSFTQSSARGIISILEEQSTGILAERAETK
ncbi:RNB domain-containing ribonuclease [Gammaproteobacteria bacterium]|nr:RNB domain-containing ribonuclease [Gammaproteobacteria bacterium]